MQGYPKVEFVEIYTIPSLRNPIMIIAMSGWNDASEAATGALEHLLTCWKGETASLIAEIDSEEFYDFQVNRPEVSIDDELNRQIIWPTTQVYGLVTKGLDRDLIVVTGVEPSMRWKQFTYELLDLADDLEVSLIITIGSMLADVPHTRPIAVGVTGGNSKVALTLGLETSKYEGPTGVLGIIQDGCTKRGIDAVSMWAAVPHYASNAPSPKASLALINSLEDFLEVSIELGELPIQADLWEQEVNELASQDVEVAEYVKALEESKDAVDLPEASGDLIAKEFERYLRRRNQE